MALSAFKPATKNLVEAFRTADHGAGHHTAPPGSADVDNAG